MRRSTWCHFSIVARTSMFWCARRCFGARVRSWYLSHSLKGHSFSSRIISQLCVRDGVDSRTLCFFAVVAQLTSAMPFDKMQHPEAMVAWQKLLLVFVVEACADIFSHVHYQEPWVFLFLLQSCFSTVVSRYSGMRKAVICIGYGTRVDIIMCAVAVPVTLLLSMAFCFDVAS